MKKFAKCITVGALMITAVMTAAGTPKLNVFTTGMTNAVVLTMEAPINGVQLTLLDVDLHLIYSEKMNQGTFSKKLNFKDLKDGTYYLTADDRQKQYTYTLSLKNSKVELVSTDEMVKPFFRKTDKMVLMNYLNLNKAEVSMKVYDEQDRVVFSGVSKELIIEKAFNFTDAYAGTYRLVLRLDGKSYSEEFVVK